MDILLTSVTIALLTLAMLFWMSQARHWKRKAIEAELRAERVSATVIEAELRAERVSATVMHASADSWEAGWGAGKKHAIGLAVKADLEQRDILAALRGVGQEEPVVKVLEQV